MSAARIINLGEALRHADEIVKVCACGRRYSRSGWFDLELVGEQGDGAVGVIEMRNCAGCGSTIAIEVPK